MENATGKVMALCSEKTEPLVNKYRARAMLHPTSEIATCKRKFDGCSAGAVLRKVGFRSFNSSEPTGGKGTTEKASSFSAPEGPKAQSHGQVPACRGPSEARKESFILPGLGVKLVNHAGFWMIQRLAYLGVLDQSVSQASDSSKRLDIVD